jgi:hypothetical protein
MVVDDNAAFDTEFSATTVIAVDKQNRFYFIRCFSSLRLAFLFTIGFNF